MAIKLDDKTTIPLFGVVLAMPALIGGILWLSNIDAKSTQALSGNDKNENSLRDQGRVLQEIRESVVRIEEKLKRGVKNDKGN